MMESEESEGEPKGMQGILCRMMKLMQGMQARQTQILDVKRQKELEVVKSGIAELPRLQEWKPDTAPLEILIKCVLRADVWKGQPPLRMTCGWPLW